MYLISISLYIHNIFKMAAVTVCYENFIINNILNFQPILINFALKLFVCKCQSLQIHLLLYLRFPLIIRPVPVFFVAGTKGQSRPYCYVIKKGRAIFLCKVHFINQPHLVENCLPNEEVENQLLHILR